MNIQHDKNAKMFVATIDGKTSTLKYEVLSDGKTLDFYSTFVPQELRGQNIGNDIVKYALDYAKENNYQVLPSCPFVKQIIERNPEYKKLVAD